jgi:hypothetical protein
MSTQPLAIPIWIALRVRADHPVGAGGIIVFLYGVVCAILALALLALAAAEYRAAKIRQRRGS